MRKKTGIVLMCFGIAAVLSALLLLCYNLYENKKAGESAADILSSIEVNILDSLKNNGQSDSDALRVVEIDGYGYIGYLTIPALDLDLPVMSEWDYVRLKTAPCLYYGSPREDNFVIAAHNYAKHFGRLNTLMPGDLVIFNDMDGRSYSYEVVRLEMLLPDQVTEMIDSDSALTLYTCTVGGAKRVTVRCKRRGAAPTSVTPATASD